MEQEATVGNDRCFTQVKNRNDTKKPALGEFSWILPRRGPPTAQLIPSLGARPIRVPLESNY